MHQAIKTGLAEGMCGMVSQGTLCSTFTRVNGRVEDGSMAYEPGSQDCRLLIEAKASLERALHTLNGLPHTDHIQRQLISIYNQLEGMHDLKRAAGQEVSFRTADWSASSTTVQQSPITKSE